MGFVAHGEKKLAQATNYKTLLKETLIWMKCLFMTKKEKKRARGELGLLPESWPRKNLMSVLIFMPQTGCSGLEF